MSRGEPTHAVRSAPQKSPNLQHLPIFVLKPAAPALPTASITVPSHSFAAGVKCTDAGIAVMTGPPDHYGCVMANMSIISDVAAAHIDYV